MDDTLTRWGQNIAEAREAAGLTQLDLAERMGVKRATVSRWEGGRMEPHRRHKPRLAAVLGKDVAVLFSYDDEEVA